VSHARTRGPAAKNRLLEALPRPDREHLLAGCEQVPLTVTDVLCEADQRIRHVFFPTVGFISLIVAIGSEAGLEVGLVGDEGMLGSSLVLGVNVTPQRALVQGSGEAWRMSAAQFRRELDRCLPLRRMLHRYVYVKSRQLAQTAVCTRFHLVDARLARWLLMTSDRAHSDTFYITQEFISSMLGVRRAGVNRAAGLLQERKLVSYSRGRLAILDRRGLQADACACYAADRATYREFMG
jgi:CRP-like cAMP-binding protein